MATLDDVSISEYDFRKRYEYTSDDLIGEGGFARVYKAYDKQFKEHVALKFYFRTDSDKYDVLNEMRDSRQYAHKNIIRVYDAYVVKTERAGSVYYEQVGVIEYAEGGNFKDFVETKPPQDVFDDVLIGILSALEYLHNEKGVIHRDLSPDNILMFREGERWIPKLADFGISKKMNVAEVAGDVQKSTQLVGKVDYMSPEQFDQKKYGIGGGLNTNVDIWSFGIILFESFTNERPFGGNTNENILSSINAITQDALPSSINSIEEPYQTIIKKCLIKRANKRINTAREIIDILHNKEAYKTKDSNIKRRLLQIVVVIGFVAILSGLGWGIYWLFTDFNWFQDNKMVLEVKNKGGHKVENVKQKDKQENSIKEETSSGAKETVEEKNDNTVTIQPKDSEESASEEAVNPSNSPEINKAIQLKKKGDYLSALTLLNTMPNNKDVAREKKSLENIILKEINTKLGKAENQLNKSNYTASKKILKDVLVEYKKYPRQIASTLITKIETFHSFINLMEEGDSFLKSLECSKAENAFFEAKNLFPYNTLVNNRITVSLEGCNERKNPKEIRSVKNKMTIVSIDKPAVGCMLTKVENNKSETIFTVKVKSKEVTPPSLEERANFFLKTVDNVHEVKDIRKGDKEDEYELSFPRLPDEIEKVDLIENESKYGYQISFFGVKLGRL